MEEIIFFIFMAIMIVIVIAVIFFSKKGLIKRKLKNSNLKRVANFRNGETARIVGKVEVIDTPLKAPLSGRKCTHYHVLVEQQVSTGNTTTWKKIIEDEFSSKYVIKDGSHYAYINDRRMQSYIVEDMKYTSGFWKDATERLESYLNSYGKESEGYFGLNKTLRYKEGVLEPGEKIAVLGKGEWKDAVCLNLPERYGKVLEITSNSDEAIYLSDDPETTVDKSSGFDSGRRENRERREGRYRK
jgi:hypothetical protein